MWFSEPSARLALALRYDLPSRHSRCRFWHDRWKDMMTMEAKVFLGRGFGTLDNVLMFWFGSEGGVTALYILSKSAIQLSEGNQDSQTATIYRTT